MVKKRKKLVDHKCTACGHVQELFTDESESKCSKCGNKSEYIPSLGHKQTHSSWSQW